MKILDFNLNSFNDMYSNPILENIIRQTQESGFDMASSPKTGAFLQTICASKPNGNFLEIGTGTGMGSFWMLQGMDKNSRLTSIENDNVAYNIAKQNLGYDERVNFLFEDGLEYLKAQKTNTFDIIFADAIPGKYVYLIETLQLLKVGGLYIVDDMKPQDDWPEDHFLDAHKALQSLKSIRGMITVGMDWSTGLILLCRSQSKITSVQHEEYL